MLDKVVRIAELESDADLPRALVFGSGLSGLIAAKALIDVGIGVTLVKNNFGSDSLYCSAPGFNREAYLRELSEAMKAVEVIGSDEWPKLRRYGPGFLADFGDGNEKFHGCVFLTSGVVLQPAAANLPEGVELISPETTFPEASSAAFLLDCESPSHPAVGMAAIRRAMDNREAGGESFILFKQAPVVHLFGEELYETAKRLGVRFYRCSEEPPAIEAISPDEADGAQFRISFQPLFGGEDQIVLTCDRLLVSGRPDPASIPKAMVEIAEHDVNERGLLLSSSTHCHSGRSFRNGIFAVGESTGELDLIRTIAQAATAAATARARMLRARKPGERDTVIFTEECTRCLTCLRICPHSAVHFQEGAGRSTFGATPALCQECGICVAECPRLVLDLASLPEETVSSFLREIKKVKDSRPIVVYGCSRSAARAAAHIELPEGVLFFCVPCTGRVSEAILWATLAAGANGVLVVGCHHGNCASETGADWARARVEAVVEKLGGRHAMPLPVKFATLAANEPSRFGRIIAEFSSALHINTDPVAAIS
jgi:quinone-modifying oxidoreductase, subunit QmoB